MMHDQTCEEFYPDFGEPEHGVCRVCGEWVDPIGELSDREAGRRDAELNE